MSKSLVGKGGLPRPRPEALAGGSEVRGKCGAWGPATQCSTNQCLLLVGDTSSPAAIPLNSQEGIFIYLISLQPVLWCVRFPFPVTCCPVQAQGGTGTPTQQPVHSDNPGTRREVERHQPGEPPKAQPTGVQLENRDTAWPLDSGLRPYPDFPGLFVRSWMWPQTLGHPRPMFLTVCSGGR